jgi:hypothetical protein
MKNLSKIISFALILFSIFLLAYVLYRAEVYHSGEKISFYLKYYIFSILLFIFSIIFLFLNNELKKIISIILFSIIISFYMIEAYLFINSKQYKIITSKIDYDYRTQYEAYKDFQSIEKEIVSTIGPVHSLKTQNQSLFPLSGISNSKTLLCNENGFFTSYQSDRYGFNNPDYEWDKKKIDFLIAGDSFAQGWCVNRKDSIAGILRKKFSNKGVITLGQVGNGPLTNYAALREYLPLIETDKVIWMHFEGDDLSGNYFQGLKQEIKNDILNKYLYNLEFSQDLYLKQDQVNKVVRKILDFQINEYQFSGKSYMDFKYTFFKFIKMFKLRNFINLKLDQIQNKNAKDIQKINPEYKLILKYVKNIVEENNAKLYFVFLPELNRYKLRVNDEKFNDYRKLINFIKSLDIPIIDLHEEVFKKIKNPKSLYPWKTDVHYTIEGYKIVSEIIGKNLK